MARYFPDFPAFEAAASDAQLIPVYRQMMADHLTPVTAFELLGRALPPRLPARKRRRRREDRPLQLHRHQPDRRLPGRLRQGPHHRRPHRHDRASSPPPTRWPTCRSCCPKLRYHRDPQLPAFTGGLVGFAGYDTIRYYEGEKLNAPPKDDRHLPDLLFGLYGELVIFDHVDKTIKIVANADVNAHAGLAEAYADAKRRDRRHRAARCSSPHAPELGEIDRRGQLTLPYESNFTQDGFEQAVAGRQGIHQGRRHLPVRPLPAPARAQRGRPVRRLPRPARDQPLAVHVLPQEPELHADRRQPRDPLPRAGRHDHQPPAGRHAPPRRDRGRRCQALEKELLADPKERAEHIMLVDLHRNDVGRVAKVGTVEIADVMTVERYSHVMHITTNVTGMLRGPVTALDALRVSLPVGTVCGAPKIRAMQIIDELEPTRRGPYGGAVGYLDFAGNMDTCIALRTIVWKDGIFDVQAGAGIVADSVPASEYEETMNKAKAMLKAVEIAHGGF